MGEGRGEQEGPGKPRETDEDQGVRHRSGQTGLAVLQSTPGRQDFNEEVNRVGR